MSNQTIGVNLKFSADVSAAKRAMADLQSSLSQINSLSMNSKIGTQFSAELSRATQAAAQLRIQLQNAYNQDTGKLNLAKFNQQLQNSGMSIAKYKQELSLIGPQGQQAFNQLAYSVATAETKTLMLGEGIRRLGTTFMNTFRYQISSSVIMGFVSGIREAVDYVKELNTSLNNIRIVTDYGVDEMKEFADYANKAAKALSTSTKSITDASLIFFQQGLNMKEAQQRAETTVKMANVVGESVETVSDQLTAIWNNFYDGTQTLEYYADVIAALGAATASSSDEISEGLEKFAAVANTVGLTYEYATAALATVTAETRQSADVVGTAFKTLFARIQDLELGKTLDDGTTLGQYSQALAKVGINIKDANGGLKDMNSILDEMGAKWKTLSKDQQVALAQNVAGTRQYTQLVALMDKWDQFQTNLNTASGASGFLEKQQETYAESWEAASQRVKAALETIYNSLLNDEVFIDMIDTFSDFLEMLNGILKGLGGLPGLLTLVGAALTKAFAPQIISGANNLAASFMSMTASGREKLAATQQEANNALLQSTHATGIVGVENESLRNRASVRQAYNQNSARMTEDARRVAELRMSAYEGKVEEYLGSKEVQDNRKIVKEASQIRFDERKKASLQYEKKKFDELESQKRSISDYEKNKIMSEAENAKKIYTEQGDKLRQSSAAKELTAKTSLENESLDILRQRQGSSSAMDQADIEAHNQSLQELESRLKSIGAEAEGTSQHLKTMVGEDTAQQYQNYAGQVDKVKQALDRLEQAEQSGDTEQIKNAQSEYDKELQELERLNGELDEHIAKKQQAAKTELENAGATDEYIVSEEAAGRATGETAREMSNLNQEAEEMKRGFNNAGNASLTFGDKIQKGSQAMMSLGMALSSIRGIVDVLNNQDMTFGEKLISIMTTLGMTIPMVISGFTALKALTAKSSGGKLINSIATWGQVQAEKELARQRLKQAGATKVETAEEAKNTVGKKANKLSAKQRWNSSALEKSSRFELVKKGKNKGQYQIMSGKGQGTFVDASTAGEMAGRDARIGAAKGAVSAIGTVAIIAGAIAAGKALYEKGDELINGAAKAASRAAQASKELSEQYSKISSEYDNMKNSLKSYNDNVKELSELKKGTKEYSEAIEKANEEALELIRANTSLVYQYYTTSEGLIVFKEGALESAEAMKEQAKAAAQLSSLLAEQGSRSAQTRSNTTDFLRENIKGNTRGIGEEDVGIMTESAGVGVGVGAVGGAATMLTAAAMGAKLGSALGSWAPVVGTAIGAVVGAVLGVAVGGIIAAIDKKEATKEEKQSMKILSKVYEKIGDAALTRENITLLLEQEGITDPALIASLDENSVELKKLFEETRKNNALRKIENTNLARQMAETNDLTFTSYGASAQSAIAAIEGAIITKREDEIEYKNKGGRKSESFIHGLNDGTVWGEKTVKQYLEAQGFTDVDAKNFKKNSVKVKYFDKEKNDYETKDINYETIAAWKEGQVISEELKAKYNEIKNDILKIEMSNAGEGFLTALAGQDINNLTEDQFNAFKEAYENNEFASIIEKYGAQTGENYALAVEKAIENWDYDEALNNYSKRTNQEIQSIFQTASQATGVSTKALENYSKALMKNSEALQTNNKFQKITNEKVAADAAVANAKFVKGVEKLNTALKNTLPTLITWEEQSLDTWEAVAEVQKALEGVFGVQVSADFIKNNLKEIKELADGNTESLEKLQAEAARDFAINLDVSEQASNDLLAMINRAIKAAENEVDGISIDASLDDSSYLTSLNKMLEAGELTADQVQSAFNALGYSVDIRTTKKEVKNISEFSMSSNNGMTYSGTIVNKSVMDVPYIAGKNTKTPGTNFTTSSGDNVVVGRKYNGDGFTYLGGAKLKGASLKDLKDTSKIKELDDVDYFHEEDKVLSHLERTLKNISREKDRAFGKDKIKLIKEEIATLQAANKVNEQYLDDLINHKEVGLKVQAENLSTKYGFDFDPDTGIITDWEEQMELRKEWYEKQMIAYQGTDYEDSIQTQYDDFIKDTEKYEEYLEKYYNKQDEIREDAIKELDARLEAVDLIVNLKIEVEDAKLERLERLFEKLDDPIDNAAMAIDNLNQQLDANLVKAEKAKTGIINLLAETGIEFDLEGLASGDFSSLEGKTLDANQLEKIKQQVKNLQSATEGMDNYSTQVMEVISNFFEGIQKEADKLNNELEHYGALLKTYENVINLIGRKASGISDETLKNLSRAQVEIAHQQTLGAKQTLESLQQSKEQLEQARSGLTGDAYDKMSKEIESLDEQILEAEANFEKSFENELQVIAEDFKTATEITLRAFEESISGTYGTLEKMQEAYNQQKEISELYVADYQKVYELSKLNRDINQTLSKTDSVKNKQALMELQQELNDLEKEGVKVSQYDLDYLRKKYELRLAEIALEENLNAKSQVRMRRDSEGNWAYVYTTDLEKVSDAQQNYEDKLYEIMKFSQDYLDEMESMIIQNQRDMVDALRNLHEEDFATVKEYETAKQEIIEYYTAKDMYLRGEMDKAISNSAEIYETDCLTYEGYTGKKINEDKRFRTQFTETFSSLNEQYKTSEEAAEAFQEKIKEVSGKLSAEFNTWKGFVKTACTDANKELSDWTKLDGTLDKEIIKIKEKISEIGDKFSTLGESASTGLQGILDAFSAKWDEYDDYVENWVYGAGRIEEAMINLLDYYAEIQEIEVPEINLPDLNNDKNENKKLLVSDLNGNDVEDEEELAFAASGDLNSSGYFGTYTINGETYRTSETYQSEKEAEDAAAKARASNVSDITLSQRYLASTGRLNPSEVGKVKASASGDGAEFVTNPSETLYSTYNSPSSTEVNAGKDVKSYQDTNNRVLYFSKDSNVQDVRADGNTHVIIKAYDQEYRFTNETASKIASDFGSNILNKWVSGSGDFIFHDPYFEKNDKIVSTDQNKGVKGYWFATAEDGTTVNKYKSDFKYGISPGYQWDTVQLSRNFGNSTERLYFTGLWIEVGGKGYGVKKNLKHDDWYKTVYPPKDANGNSNPYAIPGLSIIKAPSNNKSRWAPLWFPESSLLSQFDTGGYTGEWDSSGRLAMLHQKEIVLNAHDTENFLAAVNIVRDIASAIDLRAAAYEHQLAKLAYPAMLQGATQTIQQDVTIHAEFPNVRERTEIEAAFDNLINRASQLANRKN